MSHRSVTHTLHKSVSHEGMTHMLCHACRMERGKGESLVTQTRPGDSYPKYRTSNKETSKESHVYMLWS
jgi:hypothetical protein